MNEVPENEIYYEGETELCLPPRQAAMVEAGEPLGSVVVATNDLFWKSKIHPVADHYGLPIQFTKTLESSLEQVAADEVGMLLVDLESTDVGTPALVREARDRHSDLLIIGFVRHVHEDRRDAAMEAGMSRCYTRAQFSALLPEILGILVGK